MKTSREIDWTTVAVTLVGLAWGTWYVLSTWLNPFDEPESAWLITPILLTAWITAPFVVFSAVGPLPERLQVDENESLRHPNRRLFLFGLPVLAGGIFVLGFLPAALVYAPLTMWGMGERRPGVHLATIAILAAIIVLGFGWALGVDLPLWPQWP